MITIAQVVRHPARKDDYGGNSGYTEITKFTISGTNISPVKFESISGKTKAEIKLYCDMKGYKIVQDVYGAKVKILDLVIYKKRSIEEALKQLGLLK